MAWDPALLRKYNATGHFRLLNQVRNELKDQPIQRPLITIRSSSNRPAVGRGEGGRAQASGQGRRRSAALPATPSPAATSHDPIVMVPVLTDAFLDDSFSR